MKLFEIPGMVRETSVSFPEKHLAPLHISRAKESR